MKTDIEIAQETKMLPITTVASQYGITEDDLELYGKYKAKISNELWQEIKDRPDGKTRSGDSDQPDSGRRGKDHNQYRTCTGDDKVRKESDACSP